MEDGKLSVNNMVEMAMGLSMASLFTQAMNNAAANTNRMINNDRIGVPPRYIHAITDGVKKGPFSVGEIVAMIRSGEVTQDTYLWKPGMLEWKCAKDIDDISLELHDAPPAEPKPENTEL